MTGLCLHKSRLFLISKFISLHITPNTMIGSFNLKIINLDTGLEFDPRPVIYVNAPEPATDRYSYSTRIDPFEPVYAYNSNAVMVDGKYNYTPVYPSQVEAHKAWVNYYSYITTGHARREISNIRRLISEGPFDQSFDWGRDNWTLYQLTQSVLVELVNGADPNEVDENGQSLLIDCTNIRSTFYIGNVLELLIEWGADYYATFQGKTAVDWMVYRGSARDADLLQDFIDKREMKLMGV